MKKHQRECICHVVVTGDEIIAGHIHDLNTALLAQKLAKIGISIGRVTTVGDSTEAISSAVAASLAVADVILVTGGLGPTHDDVTSEAVASALGIQTAVNDQALAFVIDRQNVLSKQRSFEMAKPLQEVVANKQATLPVGADPLPPYGIAPGYVLQYHSAEDRQVCVGVFPGPPAECMHAYESLIQHAWFKQVYDYHAQDSDMHESTVHGFGIPEAVIVDALDRTGHTDTRDANITICARQGMLEVRIKGRHAQRVDELQHLCTTTLGDNFAGSDSQYTDTQAILASYIKDLALKQQITLAVAESCTGGLIASSITDIAGSSQFFAGATVAYSTAQKRKLLGVSEDVLEADTLVTEAVAQQMAHGAATRHNTNCAVGITGLFGPDGDASSTPIGTFWLAWWYKEQMFTRRFSYHHDRNMLKKRATNAALAGLISIMRNNRLFP